MQRRYISVDVAKCMGCHTCELACAMAHGSTDDLSALIRSGEKPGYRIFVESYQSTSIPVPCNHCEEAACILACPTGACHRESEGAPVLVDNDKCIGCRMCVQACPFGMISVHPLGSGVVKCDLCILRLAQGEDPACVSSCPTKALSFAEEEEVNRSKRLKVAERMAAAKETEEA
mgnify:FL=1